MPLFLLAMILVLFSAGCDGLVVPDDARNSLKEWQAYSGDWSGSKYSALDQINRGNVGKLEVAWVYRAGDSQESPPTTIECNPILVGGLLFLTTPGLSVVALDPSTGIEEWRFDASEGRSTGGVNRGLVWWGEGNHRRIFFAAGNYLHAIDASDGKPVESFGSAGRIDLREGLDRDVSGLQVSATTPGVVFEDCLIVGTAVGEGPGPAAPGHIRAYDARTGQRLWIFHTIPHPGEVGYESWPPEAYLRSGGANAWGGFTLDSGRGWVFFGTGSPSYDHYGGDRKGSNLFGNCVVALDARTGKRIWHYQVVHHDIWDYDVPCPPNLVRIEIEGRWRDAVAQPTKMGHLFVLDRETGEPIWGVEEKAVPQSTLPGEETWPTQPFPLKPPAYAQQSFTPLEAWGASEAARQEVLERLSTMRSGSIFLPPGLDSSVVLPQFNGGTDWGGAAWDPRTSTLYVNSSSEAEWISMVPARPPAELAIEELGRRLFGGLCSPCHGAGESGVGGSASASRLKDLVKAKPAGHLAEILNAGQGQMPAFAYLSAVQMRALDTFLRDEATGERVRPADAGLDLGPDMPYVATGHHPFRDREGFPANRPPWGTLTALNLNRGEILWQVPLGTYPGLEGRGIPPTGTFNMGGPMVTAGNLVFIGGSMDEKFRACDSETGAVLWEYQLDAGGYATPMTYELGGRQYVVIAAGGGGKPETRPGDAYYAFALPGTHP